MRLQTSLVLCLFLFSAVEIPFDSLKRETHSDGCCCSSLKVCHCEHGKGAVCPMQKKPDAHALHGAPAGKAPLFNANSCQDEEKSAFSPAASKFFFLSAAGAAHARVWLGNIRTGRDALPPLLEKKFERPPEPASFFFLF